MSDIEETQATEKRGRGRPKGSKNKATIAKETMLTNWENGSMSPLMREDKAELNRAATFFLVQCMELGHRGNVNNLDTMYSNLENYLKLCVQTGMPMSVKTCDLALGVTRQCIIDWKSGKRRGDDPRYKEFAVLVDEVLQAGIESLAAAGSLDRVLLIWWEKSHFKMTEATGENQEPDDVLGERKTAKEIVEKYNTLPD